MCKGEATEEIIVEQLRPAMVAVAQEVCEILSGKEMPMRDWTRIESIDENKNTSFSVGLSPDISVLLREIFRIGEKLTSLKQLHVLIEANPRLTSIIFCDATGQPITSHGRLSSSDWSLVDAAGRCTSDIAAKPIYWIFRNLITPFFADYFSTIKTIAFDSKIVNSTIDILIDKLQTPKTSFISVSPLINLDLTMDILIVAPGVSLRKLSTNELEKWINSSCNLISPPFSNMDIVDLQCAAEISKEGQSDILQLREILKKLIDILRLLTDRNIYISFTEEYSQESSRPLLGQFSQSWGPSLRSSRLLKNSAVFDSMNDRFMLHSSA
jgi:hypothetical protein